MSKDVELVIRARQEGAKALESFTAGVKELVGLQEDLAASSKSSNSQLAILGTEMSALGREVKNLQEFGRVVSNLDKAATAVDRLQGRVSATTRELEGLTRAQQQAAAATAQAKVAADEAARAYDAQRVQAAAIRKESGATSAAYLEQAAATRELKTQRDAANQAVSRSAAEEKRLSTSIKSTAATLETSNRALAEAQTGWEELYRASAQASKGMAGIAANQDEIARASARAADKLRLAKDAVDFRTEAQAAQKLREAAGYVQFWTQALNEKEAAEARANANKLEPAPQLQGFTKSAEDSFRVFEAAGRMEDKMAAAAERLRTQINPMVGIQARLNIELTKARDLYRVGYINANELADAERELAAEATRAAQALNLTNKSGGGGAFLGLRPYELHSLSFQINDVFTQLASGTPIMQVLAQQGGQVFQVFQRQLVPAVATLGPAAAAAAPQIAIVVAALVVLAAAMKNIGDRAKSVREFGGALAASADGAKFSAAALAENAHQLDVYGTSLAQAKAALKEFVAAGINPALFDSFGRTTKDFADVTGKEIPTAAKEAAEAFSAGYDAIAKLDEGLNFLSVSERKRIKDLFDSGQAEKGRTEAFQIFARQMDDGARKMRSNWGEAIRNLAGAWDNLLGFIENSAPIRGAISLLGDLAKAAKEVTDLLPGAEARTAEATAALAAGSSTDIVKAQAELTRLQKERTASAEREARIAARGGPQFNRTQAPGQPYAPGNVPSTSRSTADIDRDIAATQTKIINLRKAVQDTIVNGSEAQKKAAAEALSSMERERRLLGDLTDQDKVRLAGETAYQEAIRETGNVAVAAGRRRLAIEKELDAQRRSISFERLAGKIIGAESGGTKNPNTAKNPNSTATGAGQFIERTWLSMFRKYFPAQAQKMGEAAILDLRRDSKITKDLVELYARENAKILQAAGLAVNEASLYLAHFLGPNGAVKVLSASAATPVANLLKQDAINANKSILQGKNAGQVVAFAQRKVGNSDVSRATIDTQADIAAELIKSEKDREKAQVALNTAIDEENRKRQQIADSANATAGLTSQALIDEERRLAIAAALADAVADVTRASDAEILAGRQALSLTEAQKAAIEATAAAEFDALNQSRRLATTRTDTEEALNSIFERRTLLLEQIGLAQQQGQTDVAADLIAQYDALGVSLDSALEKALLFWQALAGDPERAAMLGLTTQQIENMVTSLQNAGMSANNLNTQFIQTGRQINESIANRGAQAFDQFAEAVAGGANVFKSAKNAFLGFASDFLRQIAQMIIQQIIFNAISGAFGGGTSGSGGIGGIISGAIGGVIKRHSGGLVGPGGGTAPAAWFANAARYHGGGLAGLQPGEVPAILKRNEEVLTEDDPRHIFNSGGAPGGNAEDRFKIVNLLDTGSLLEAALNTRVGEQAILNHIRANATSINGMLTS